MLLVSDISDHLTTDRPSIHYCTLFSATNFNWCQFLDFKSTYLRHYKTAATCSTRNLNFSILNFHILEKITTSIRVRTLFLKAQTRKLHLTSLTLSSSNWTDLSLLDVSWRWRSATIATREIHKRLPMTTTENVGSYKRKLTCNLRLETLYFSRQTVGRRITGRQLLHQLCNRGNQTNIWYQPGTVVPLLCDRLFLWQTNRGHISAVVFLQVDKYHHN